MRPTIYGPDGKVANPKPTAGFVAPQTNKPAMKIEETREKRGER